MPGKMPNALNSIALSFKALSAAKKITLVCLLAAAAAGFSTMLYWIGQPDYQVLYSNLAPEDAGAILLKLKEQKIPYQAGADGRSILVSREKLYEMRMQLATQGLPQGGGAGFELFDNTKLGMTEFVQNVNYQRALQGELSRTISGMVEVESCRTHIVIPPKSLFIDQEEDARASVAIKVRQGRQLSAGQIQGIVHLVSSSIPRLKPDNVTIVDNFGKMLAGQDRKDDMETARSEQFEYQEKMERGMESRIKTMLTGVLGPDKAIVRVACLLDFRREEKTAESYLPDGIAKRSEQINQNDSEGPGGISAGTPAGVQGLPVSGSEAAAGETAGAAKNGEVKRTGQHIVNYEVSKVISRVVEPVGTVKRISVAVVVDGQYKKTGEGKDAKPEYVPRSQEEIAQVVSLVKRVVNFDEGRGDKVDVVNLPFEARAAQDGSNAEPEGWLSKLQGLSQFGRYVFPALGILLLYMLIVKPTMRWLVASPVVDIEVAKRLPMTVKEIEEGYPPLGSSNSPARSRVRDVIAGDKENSIKLMRAWLSENGH